MVDTLGVSRIVVIASLALVVLASCGSDDTATTASSALPPSSAAATTTIEASTTTVLPGVEVNATASGAKSTVGDPVCDAAQHCIYPLTITATVTGDLTGTTVSQSAGALLGTEFAASGTQIFNGTVKGCGTGSMVMLATGRGSTTGTTTSSWIIAEGFGTGDLAKATGTGTTTLPPASSGSTSETLAGRITCS